MIVRPMTAATGSTATGSTATGSTAVIAAAAVAMVLATAAAAIAVLAPWTTTASAAIPVTAGSVTRSAHVSFEGCNARHIILSVTILRHPFRPGQQVPYTVRLRNTGSTTCGAEPTQGVPQARHRLTVGPCGIVSATVRNSRGIGVFPGPAIFGCPEESGFRLGAHSTAQVTTSWTQVAYVGSPPTAGQAPPGTYHLVIDHAVTVPVTLTPG
jgi:hypothetical protein